MKKILLLFLTYCSFQSNVISQEVQLYPWHQYYPAYNINYGVYPYYNYFSYLYPQRARFNYGVPKPYSFSYYDYINYLRNYNAMLMPSIMEKPYFANDKARSFEMPGPNLRNELIDYQMAQSAFKNRGVLKLMNLAPQASFGFQFHPNVSGNLRLNSNIGGEFKFNPYVAGSFAWVPDIGTYLPLSRRK